MGSAPSRIVSQSPSAVWVETTEIQNRFDAMYFSADFLRLDNILAQHSDSKVSRLGDLLSEPRRIMYLNTEAFEQKDLPDGVRFISGVDVDEATMSIKWNTVTHVAPWMLDKYPGGKLFDGALLIKVKGPNQLATYVESVSCDALVSGTFVMARVRNVDPWFLTSYLTQAYAQAWRTRLRQNITVEFTPYDELAEIPVITPAEDLQRAIGNMLRKAERLRLMAAEADSAFNEWMDRATRPELSSKKLSAFLEQSPDSTISDSSWVTAFDPGDRVDPWPNHEAPRTIREHLDRVVGADRFGHFFSIVDDRSKRPASMSPKDHHISILHVEGDGYIDWKASRLERVEGEGVEVEAGDILYALLNPKETRVGFIPPSFYGTAVASTEFGIIRPVDDARSCPYLLCAVLRSNWVRVQSTFLTRSSSLSRRRLQERDLEKLFIPWVDEGSAELNRKLEFATTAKIESAALIQQAQKAVSAFIEGKLDEGGLRLESEELEIWLQENPIPNSIGGQ